MTGLAGRAQLRILRQILRYVPRVTDSSRVAIIDSWVSQTPYEKGRIRTTSRGRRRKGGEEDEANLTIRERKP